MSNNIHTLIFPDIHGRTFWKEAIKKYNKNDYPNLVIVFLGDYVDPYDFEYITRLAAINNFKEIIETAKEDNRIHLLIGNHDMHYWYDARYKSRVDYKNYDIIKDLFLQNFTLFDIAYEETINDMKYLYTHAGVTSYWLKHLRFIGKLSVQNNKEYRIDKFGKKIKKLSDEQLPFAKMLESMTPDADKLNKMKLNFQGQANLWMSSIYRGGENDCGSCIWADFQEWLYENSNIDDENLFQIFGHTLSANGFDNAVIDYDKRYAMLDSRQAWVLTNDNKFISIKNF
jgi:predicted phosphodiesterase